MTDIPIDVLLNESAHEAAQNGAHAISEGSHVLARECFQAAEAAYDALSSLLVVDNVVAQIEDQAEVQDGPDTTD